MIQFTDKAVEELAIIFKYKPTEGTVDDIQTRRLFLYEKLSSYLITVANVNKKDRGENDLLHMTDIFFDHPNAKVSEPEPVKEDSVLMKIWKTVTFKSK